MFKPRNPLSNTRTESVKPTGLRVRTGVKAGPIEIKELHIKATVQTERA